MRRWGSSLVAPTTLYAPAISDILVALPYMTISQRKVLLDMTRTQPPELWDSRFRQKHLPLLSDTLPINYNDIYTGIPLPQPCYKTIGTLLRNFIYSEDMKGPLRYALLSVAIRHAPYVDYGSMLEEKQRILKKEIEAMRSPAHNEDLNYSLWFSEDIYANAMDPLCHNIPGDWNTTMDIRFRFLAARRLLQGKRLFPRLATKTIGVVAKRMCDQEMQFHGGYHVENLLDVERIYHHQGIQLHGPAEMRSAWKYNDLKPRVYYAQGPTAFQVSKYIQAIMGTIVDCFPMVHRIDRYAMPNDSEALPDEVQFIYDYTSFTSNLPKARDFMSAMADYFQDITVEIIDSHKGPMHVSVGDLLREYNEVCNTYPEVDIGSGLGFEENIEQHHAGMLGVPGNIAMCTLLHGLHLTYISSGGMMSCRCVGDDARAKRSQDITVAELVFQLSNLGSINESRTEEWWMEDAFEEVRRKNFSNYIKRPVYRDIAGRLQQGDLLQCPDLSIMLGMTDEYHRQSSSTEGEKVKAILRQWRRLLDRIRPYNLSALDRDILYHLQRLVMKFANITAAWESATMVWLRNYMVGFAPQWMSREDFGGDWRDISVRRSSVAVLRVLEPCYDPNGDVYMPLYPGGEFACNLRPELRWLEQMEYLSKSSRTIEVAMVDLLHNEHIRDFWLSTSYVALYDYRVHRLVPSWIDQIANHR